MFQKIRFLFAVSLVLLSFSGAQSKSTVTDFQIPISGNAENDLGLARIGFLKSCDALASQILESPLNAYVQKLTCLETGTSEKRETLSIQGALSLTFTQPLKVDVQSLETGFAKNSAVAEELYASLCTHWLNEKPLKDRSKNTLLQSCGIPVKENFYEKPAIKSLAFRFEKTRSAFRNNEFCFCRERTFPVEYETPWGVLIRYKSTFDLMLLKEEGYYEKQGTYDHQNDCSDEMNKVPACHD